jgi:hypothetical protein
MMWLKSPIVPAAKPDPKCDRMLAPTIFGIAERV